MNGDLQIGAGRRGVVASMPDALRMAVAAHLARFKGQSRAHTESDLRAYLTWCQLRGLDPPAATRPHVELYVRWLQEVRRFKASTVSRRTSVVAGFYRMCVIDGVLEHSSAEHVRRPNVPPEATSTTSEKSTATGFSECAAKAARSSSCRYHLPWVAPSSAPSETVAWVPSCSTATEPGWTATTPPDGCGIWQTRPEFACHDAPPHAQTHLRDHDARGRC